nr:tyrosine-type recombinase/integrase [Cytophagales bacterium]
MNGWKSKYGHAIPLSRQALEIIQELRTISGKGELVFPGWKNPQTPISDVTLTKVLRIMGYDKKNKKHVVPSGFRATASTILNEKGFNRDAIERQLAHVEENRVRAAYHHSEYMEVRKEMMQWYADYLDEVKASYEGDSNDKE